MAKIPAVCLPSIMLHLFSWHFYSKRLDWSIYVYCPWYSERIGVMWYSVTRCCCSCSLAVSGRPPVGLAADSWLSVLLSHWRNSSNSPWKPSAFTETGELLLILLLKFHLLLLLLFSSSQYLLQGGLQQLLPLLGLEQEALPALVQMIQLVPQVAGLVTRRGLQ